MMLSARLAWLLVLAWALASCSGRSPSDPAPPAPPLAPPTPLFPAPDPPEAVAGVSRLPPAPPAGLPPVTRGPRVRLRAGYRPASRRVDGRRVQVVTLVDAAARPALDAQLERLEERCQVELALPRLVALRCTPRDEHGRGAPHAVIFSIEGSTVTSVEPLSLFLEGADAESLARWLQYDPAGPVAPLVLTDSGVELRLTRHHVVRVPFRTLAPLLRPGTALADALVAEGLSVAAPGTPFPPPPPVTVGVWADDPGSLLDAWRALPAHLRPLARLADTAGGRAALVFPPGVTEVGAATAPAFFVQPLAELVLARAEEGLEIVDAPGERMVRSARPEGTLLTLARGPVGGRDSEPGRRQWVYVRTGETAGWARGGHVQVTEPTDCGELTPPGESVRVHEQGVFHDGSDVYVWFLTSPLGDHRARDFSLHPLAACAVGPAVQQRALEHVADFIQLLTPEPGSARRWLVLLDRQRPTLTSTLVVYDPARSEAVLEQRGRVLGVQVDQRVGPEGAQGHFPLQVLSGAERTWYRAEDGGLRPVRVPERGTPVPAADALGGPATSPGTP